MQARISSTHPAARGRSRRTTRRRAAAARLAPPRPTRFRAKPRHAIAADSAHGGPCPTPGARTAAPAAVRCGRPPKAPVSRVIASLSPRYPAQPNSAGAVYVKNPGIALGARAGWARQALD